MTYPALSALTFLDGVSIGQRRGVVAALAVLQPSLLVELAERVDVPAEVRADLVREAPDYLVDQVLRAMPWTNELFDAAVEVHGATPALVVLAAAHGRRQDAVDLAARLTPDEVMSVGYQWEGEFGEPLPLEVRSALVRAVLSHEEPRPDVAGMDQWQRERAIEQLRHLKEVQTDRVWRLLELEPRLWLQHANDPTHGSTVQGVLLERAQDLPDDVLLACLPTITGDKLRLLDLDDLLGGIRLQQAADWVRRHPRIREVAPERLDGLIQEVVEDGWKAEGWGSLGPDWEQIVALAELSADPALLASAVAALGAAKEPRFSRADRDHSAEWHQKRALAVAALHTNPNTPEGAIRAVLPALDEQALEVLLPSRDPEMEPAVLEHLEALRSAAASREPVIVRVPDDDELAQLPDPADELRKHVRYLKGRAAQRDYTRSGLLRSRFTTADILRGLPAALVLASQEQAHQVAALIAHACGDELQRWRSLSPLKTSAPDRKITFGAWLDALANS